MRTVVVDTNALLLPFTDGTDIQDEVERLLGSARVVVPTAVGDELRKLAEGEGASARAAAAAQRLATRFEEVQAGLPGDDGVLQVARSFRAYVLSNDKGLQGRCREAGLKVLESRGKGKLHIA